jgi:hypothetical protein
VAAADFPAAVAVLAAAARREDGNEKIRKVFLN